MNICRLCKEPKKFLYSPKRLSFFFLFLSFSFFSQTDSLSGFDRTRAIKHASYATSEAQKETMLKVAEKQFIKQRFFIQKEAVSSETNSEKGSAAGNCDNIGFENNSFNGWTITGDSKIVSGGNDPFGNFPKVFPGGKYSLQLNNNTITNKSNFKAGASKLFDVASGNTFVNLHFAMVILNYPHDSISAARFKITLRDSTNHVTLCPQFNCYYEAEKGPIGASNFSTSAVQGINTGNEQFPVTYSAWQTIGIDLSAYPGKKIALQISCDWCLPNVDWAYCYIDADCDGLVTKQMPCTKMPAVLSGPPGFQNYKWYTPQGKTITSTSSTLIIQSSGTYTLRCNQIKGCNELPFMFAYNIGQPIAAKFRVDTVPCSLFVKFTALDTLAGSKYYWKWQDSIPSYGPSGVWHLFTGPGLHAIEVEVIDKTGCISVSTLTLNLRAPIDVRAFTTDPPGSLYGPDDKKTYVAASTYIFGSLNYTWTGENFADQGRLTRIGEDGVYIVKAVDPATGCSDTASINVMLKGWIPNIFTPNNDGVNDLFRFRANRGTVLEVYDRWGNKVHESADEKAILSWDGKNLDGRDCSDGVFAYILRSPTGTRQQPSIAGLVTLLR
jgi:gliding motility-associated-like protein